MSEWDSKNAAAAADCAATLLWQGADRAYAISEAARRYSAPEGAVASALLKRERSSAPATEDIATSPAGWRSPEGARERTAPRKRLMASKGPTTYYAKSEDGRIAEYQYLPTEALELFGAAGIIAFAKGEVVEKTDRFGTTRWVWGPALAIISAL